MIIVHPHTMMYHEEHKSIKTDILIIFIKDNTIIKYRPLAYTLAHFYLADLAPKITT